MTKAKMGRPTIGGKVEARISDELAERLQAYIEAHGMSRAEAIRHLLDVALRIGEADATLETLGELSIEALFPEAADLDAEELNDLVMADHETVLYVEAEDHLVPRPTFLQVVSTRGRWISVRSERGGEDWTHHYRVFDDEAAARADFAETMTAMTEAHWQPELGTMWLEFATNLEFVYDLARSGAIPIGAIDVDGDHYPIDTAIKATGMTDLSDIDAVAEATGLARMVDRGAIAAAIARLTS